MSEAVFIGKNLHKATSVIKPDHTAGCAYQFLNIPETSKLRDVQSLRNKLTFPYKLTLHSPQATVQGTGPELGPRLATWGADTWAGVRAS